MTRVTPPASPRRAVCRAFALALALGASATACSNGGSSSSPGKTDGGTEGGAPEDPTDLAADAFVWGSPLLVTQRTLQTLGAWLHVNSLFNQTALTTPAIRVIVAPNQDTLYSVAVLDLRSEPMVLTVPDVMDRYWTYQFLDAWTNSFHYIGTRASGGRGGTFVITPPGFAGTLPAGAEQVESPTPELFLLGRYLVDGDADIPNVTKLERTLVPLSAVLGTPAPAAPPDLGKAPDTAQQVGAAGAAFFDELGDILAVNGPASDYDKKELPRFASLGIGPGLHPTATADASTLHALEAGVTQGVARLEGALSDTARLVNGWQTFLDIGTYTDNWLVRGTVAKYAWAANVPEEAVYPVSRADAQGKPYSGASRYVMHFAADRLPPVDAARGFWSLTLYGTDMFFVENAIHRYAIGDRTPNLQKNADGSLDVYIQNDAPSGHENNWLPCPTGEFVLLLRLYLPAAAVLRGAYDAPPVVAQ